jgi:hypothetical protein
MSEPVTCTVLTRVIKIRRTGGQGMAWAMTGLERAAR